LDLLEKYSWLFMIVAIFLGIFLGRVDYIAEGASHFIVPFLMVMLFGVFLQTSFGSLKAGFKNVRLAGLSFLINFVWAPA